MAMRVGVVAFCGRGRQRGRCRAIWLRVVASGILAAVTVIGCEKTKGAPSTTWVRDAREALERAVALVPEVHDDAWAATTTAEAAAVMVRIDRKTASQLVGQAVHHAAGVPNVRGVNGRVFVLDHVARVISPFDRERAIAVLRAAIDLSEKMPQTDRGPLAGPGLADLVCSLAGVDPEMAQQEAKRIPDPASRGLVLGRVAETMAKTFPQLAESVLERSSQLLENTKARKQSVRVRAQVIAQLARYHPERARALLPTVEGPENRAVVLMELVKATAASDPRRALGYVEMIKDPIAAATALRALAAADPHDARSYLQSATDAVKGMLTQTDCSEPIATTNEVAQLALDLGVAGQEDDALSLVQLAAREVRTKCHGSERRARALMLLSAGASQISPTLARDLVREALANAETFWWFSWAAGYLGALDPSLQELCVQQASAPDRALMLFEAASVAAGNQPEAARAWLRRAQELSNRMPQRREGGDFYRRWVQAEAEAFLMPQAGPALETTASITSVKWRAYIYVRVASTFLARPPAKVPARDVVTRLAGVLAGQLPGIDRERCDWASAL